MPTPWLQNLTAGDRVLALNSWRVIATLLTDNKLLSTCRAALIPSQHILQQLIGDADAVTPRGGVHMPPPPERPNLLLTCSARVVLR
jgi:hypothetical protein